jgi:hypothetical protein
MSDLAMTRFLASTPIGAFVWVQPKDLQLSGEQFHAVVQGWIANSGGPGFWCVENHRESQTGQRLYDRIRVQRTT